jgi:hypothetical protein
LIDEGCHGAPDDPFDGCRALFHGDDHGCRGSRLVSLEQIVGEGFGAETPLIEP